LTQGEEVGRADTTEFPGMEAGRATNVNDRGRLRAERFSAFKIRLEKTLVKRETSLGMTFIKPMNRSLLRCSGAVLT